MFNNIGKKIKNLAKACCWIGIGLSILYSALMVIQQYVDVAYGIVYAIVYSLVSWIASFVLYGFGQLVENSDKIAEKITKEE